mgnify:CR=1 FL=1
MNPRTTILLFTLFTACCVGVAWVVLRDAPAVDRGSRVGPRMLLPTLPPRADRISIEIGSGPGLAAWRAGDVWRFEAPEWLSGELAGLQQFDTIYTRLTSLRFLDEPGVPRASSQEAGTDNPRATIRLDYTLDDLAGLREAAASRGVKLEGPPGQKKSSTVLVGRRSGLGNETYVAVSLHGGPFEVYRIAGDLLGELPLDLSTLRDPAVLHLDMERVAGLTIHSPDALDPIRLAPLAPGDYRWRISSPVRARVNMAQFFGLLQRVATLNAMRWLHPGDSAYETAAQSIERAGLRVTVEAAAAREGGSDSLSHPAAAHTVTLELGGFADLQKSEQFARVSGRAGIAVLRAGDASLLTPAFADLRERRLFDLSLFVPRGSEQRLPMTALWIRTPEAQAGFAQDVMGQWWVHVDGQREAAAPDQIEALLNSLSNLRVSQFVDEIEDADARPSLEDAGMDSPELVVEMLDWDLQPQIVRFGRVGGAGAYQFVQFGDEPLATVSSAVGQQLRLDPYSFLARNLVQADFTDLVAMSVERSDGTHRLSRPADEATWVLDGPTAGLAGPAGVQLGEITTLAGQLVQLGAIRRVPASSPDYGLIWAAPSAESEQAIVRWQVGTYEPLEGPALPDAVTTQPVELAPAMPASRYGLVLRRVLMPDGAPHVFGRFLGQPHTYEFSMDLWTAAHAEFADPSLGLGAARSFAELTIQRAGEAAYTLERGPGNAWRLKDDRLFAVHQGAAEELARRLELLRASRLIGAGAADGGGGGDVSTIRIQRQDGSVVMLRIRPAGEGLAELEMSGRETPALIDSAMLDFILPRLIGLADAPMPSPTP